MTPKGYLDVNYFPTVLSSAFIAFILFGDVSEEDLLKSFLRFLPTDERKLIDLMLNEDELDFTPENDEFYEFFDHFKVRGNVNQKNFKTVLQEIARQELIQKPHIMANCWRNILAPLKMKPAFQSMNTLYEFYDQVNPSCGKILNLIVASPNTEIEKESLNYLKRYIKVLDSPMLKRLLQFISGSDVITIDVIEVNFVTFESSLLRRPVARTCSAMIQLPTGYNNFYELREEFTHVLSSNAWEMNIA